ncbi:FAD-binding oxidoreductase [Pikeienuella piscinae]|uniref:FAD-binding oxidoreductase n=1 Tax=Pikeienuella piscinae TaxID=2748098 RepID=A0A7L5BWS8_9RHOB|nr:FAD-binding oxidoreductase [Pikeienuella piscinae]QIE56355.1 FAD-binding oxidoreductase [Pikeienuella piscinae]
MVETADVLVVGAGVAGLGAAAHLAASARVIVLEAERAPCLHSTGRSAAVFIKSYGPPGVRAATAASEAFYETPPDGFADAPLLTPRGLLYLDYVGGGLDAMLAATPGMKPVTVDEAVELAPILKRQPIVAAAHELDARDIDIDLLTGGFRRWMRDGGARIVTDAGVTALSRESGVWRAETPAGVFEAPILINAAGAWASAVAAMAGASSIKIQPKRRSAAIVPAPAEYDVSDWPLCADAAEGWYARPTGGKLMVSPADADPVEACDIWPDDMVLAEGIDRFQQAVTFEVTRVERTWAGLRSFSPDGEPVIGFDPGCEGFFWLAGQGGYGIQTAPAFSALTADLVLDRAPALGAAAALLSPDRFV